MKFRLAVKGLIAFLPSPIKRTLYRNLYGYKIGKRVRIGLSIVDAEQCVIDDDVQIGHLNIFIGTKKLMIGDHARIGHLNIIRGGDEVRLGRYSEVVRLNEINSIPEPDVVNEVDPRFILGDGSVVVASHKIDFTDRVEFGKRVILGGRNSSLWTHNRQMTRPITVGDYSYLGSEIRIAPGGAIPAKCVVGIGSVITGKFDGEFNLIAGVPAKIVKPLGEDGRFLTEYKTRKDLPEDV
jgi:acetyltransferase-like isoleucine patch superfamily enzyme